MASAIVRRSGGLAEIQFDGEQRQSLPCSSSRITTQEVDAYSSQIRVDWLGVDRRTTPATIAPLSSRAGPGRNK